MNILFIARSTLYEVSGGDTIQIIKTAEELRKLGVVVDIKLSNEKNINYGQYDLLHFFNIIRPSDIIAHIDKCNKPFVVSSIYLLYEDFENNTSIKGVKDFIVKTQFLGASHFEGKESHSFGNLTSSEWNNMFYKHLNHHLEQFGV